MTSRRLSRSALLLGCVLAALPAAAQQPMPTATGNAAHDMLSKMSPAERNRMLDRVLHSVDHGHCDVAASTFVRYRRGREATWRATCSDGRLFVLDLMDGNDWAVAVINCEDTVEQKARCGS